MPRLPLNLGQPVKRLLPVTATGPLRSDFKVFPGFAASRVRRYFRQQQRRLPPVILSFEQFFQQPFSLLMAPCDQKCFSTSQALGFSSGIPGITQCGSRVMCVQGELCEPRAQRRQIAASGCQPRDKGRGQAESKQSGNFPKLSAHDHPSALFPFLKRNHWFVVWRCGIQNHLYAGFAGPLPELVGRFPANKALTR